MQQSAPDHKLNEPEETEPPTRFLQSLTGWNASGPLPADLDEEAVNAIAEYVRDQNRPALNKEVVALVKRLRMHYGEWSQLTEDEEAEIWRDWLLDFKRYPKALLERACSLWRNSTAKRAPTPGQLKDIVKKEGAQLVWLEAMLPRARAALADPDRRWRP